MARKLSSNQSSDTTKTSHDSSYLWKNTYALAIKQWHKRHEERYFKTFQFQTLMKPIVRNTTSIVYLIGNEEVPGIIPRPKDMTLVLQTPFKYLTPPKEFCQVLSYFIVYFIII